MTGGSSRQDSLVESFPPKLKGKGSRPCGKISTRFHGPSTHENRSRFHAIPKTGHRRRRRTELQHSDRRSPNSPGAPGSDTPGSSQLANNIGHRPGAAPLRAGCGCQPRRQAPGFATTSDPGTSGAHGDEARRRTRCRTSGDREEPHQPRKKPCAILTPKLKRSTAVHEGTALPPSPLACSSTCQRKRHRQ
jgi:hypothetical protein